MNTKTLFRTLVIAGGLFGSATLQAAEWETVDQEPGVSGTVDCIARSADGTCYASGAGLSQGIIRKSIDNGRTWQDCGKYIDPVLPATWFPGIAVSSSGEIYAAGKSGNVWLVRKCTDSVNWSTVDAFIFPSSSRCTPYKIAIDETGGIYVAGSYTERLKSGSRDHWVVRRSMDSGASWRTVDNFVTGGAADVIVSGENVFVAGHQVSDGKRWLVRKGTPQADGTVNCQTIDEYQLKMSRGSQANGLTVDLSGNLYTIGETRKTQISRTYHVVRMLPVAGNWQTIDKLEYAGQNTFGQAITVGSDGALYTTGYLGTGVGTGWFTRSLTSSGSDVTAWLGSSSTWGWSIFAAPDGALFTGGEQDGLWTIRARRP